MARWCPVTVTHADGRRHSLDVLEDSTYDAAHLFVVEAKQEHAVGWPQGDARDGLRSRHRREDL
jgi:hypothetical protein